MPFFAFMKHDTHIRIHDIEGSTVFHAVVSPRSTSEGCSGGVPLEDNAPPLHKPAVLATITPNPSQGTPGTAISAASHNMGTAPSRTSRQEVSRKTSWLERIQTELHRKRQVIAAAQVIPDPDGQDIAVVFDKSGQYLLSPRTGTGVSQLAKNQLEFIIFHPCQHGQGAAPHPGVQAAVKKLMRLLVPFAWYQRHIGYRGACARLASEIANINQLDEKNEIKTN